MYLFIIKYGDFVYLFYIFDIKKNSMFVVCLCLILIIGHYFEAVDADVLVFSLNRFYVALRSFKLIICMFAAEYIAYSI